MKKCVLSSLIIAILLTVGQSFAAVIPSNEGGQEHLLNLLTHPSAAVMFYDDVTYRDFISTLKFHGAFSLEVTRILKLASESFATAYKSEKDSNAQTKILIEWEKLTNAAITYSFKYPNRLLRDYFLKISQYLNEENYLRIERSDTTKSAHLPDKNKQIEVFIFKIEAFANRIIKRIQSQPEKLKFRGTEIEIHFDEVTVTERSANVSYITPKNLRPVIFTIKITNPSVDSSEAVFWATKALLNDEHVGGVYFDDRLKIPSKLPSDSYELSFWGKNVLIKRPSCSKLF